MLDWKNFFEAGQIVSDLSGNRDHNCGRLAKPTVIFSLGLPINVFNFIRLKEVTNLKLWRKALHKRAKTTYAPRNTDL
ncbi:MAG: hypothetical protein NZT61_05945 [Deltaproteobacteria bacterium]|nr:hypothetical protein [Deltaproteobacteria bacterium]